VNLDPAILDRPSRFDRKYTFDLPGPGERAAYVTLWNNQLQPEMRLSTAAEEKIAQGTEGFSFAYLKELFLSSMMQWMADSRTQSFEAVVLEQRTRLQSQMGATEQAATGQASAASA
jgi:ATP-dependent 26S proteasome regulatory subunit